MNIYLMRHFKVDFEWKKKYTSRGFKIAAEEYNSSTIIKQDIAFDHKNVQVYISELIRSHLTYEALGIDVKAQKTDLINEVPIAPFVDTDLKIPTPVWRVMGRVQWFLNIKKQPETRRDTLNRIEALMNRLGAEEKDVLIIGHGFYFSQLKRVLKKKGYAGNGKLYYRNGEIVKFNKAHSV
jgi:broad specificity phosphatase PhoE